MIRIEGYEFRAGVRFQKGVNADPNLVGTHLGLLQKQQGGGLNAEDVVLDAKNPNSPLHPFFEWDDTEAAKRHRLEQARLLIRSVVAVYRKDESEGETRMQAYVHVPDRDSPHYQATHEALAVPDTRELVLRRAWRELKAWQKRYESLDEFSRLFETAEEIEVQLPDDVTA